MVTVGGQTGGNNVAILSCPGFLSHLSIHLGQTEMATWCDKQMGRGGNQGQLRAVSEEPSWA